MDFFFNDTLEKVLSDLRPKLPSEEMENLVSILNQREEYVLDIINKMRDIGLFIADIENNKVYPNKLWYSWGFTDEDMLNNGYLNYVHPDDIERIVNHKSALAKAPGDKSDPVFSEKDIIFRFRKKNGEWRWLLSSAISVITDKEGKITQYIGFDHDITDEMEAKRNLEKTLKQVREAKEEAEKKVLEATTMMEISRIITSSIDLDSTIEAILDQAKRVIPYDTSSVQILKNGRLEVIGGRGWKNTEKIIGFSFSIPGHNPNTVVIQSGKPLVIADIREETEKGNFSFKILSREYVGISWLGIPLIMRGKPIGMLTFDKNEPGFFTRDHQNIGTAFASHVAIALENARIYEEIKASALTDPLTGARNRRSFFEHAREQESLFKRYGTNFALIMLDIDFFKKVNDNFGHPEGDRILKEIVLRIKSNLRDTDTLYRYGGEEFMILLPQNNEDDAFIIGERIRTDIEKNIKTQKDQKPVTVSLGCADMEICRITGIEELTALADKALYYAKGHGRNRSKRASELMYP